MNSPMKNSFFFILVDQEEKIENDHQLSLEIANTIFSSKQNESDHRIGY